MASFSFWLLIIFLIIILRRIN
ncbi:GlyGly-CTERM sorting domain-containing protein [Methanosarcina flavescens]|uniref:GlyGly-CTERM sorting domain-containing protein n=1 Tax=Methanosarcina flavescens TaxID=1715806 RepID=A0A660HVD8_9EURY|nr:GlyGly-CTERM sorting domain-containing protein [Methanosarcina flavescens]